MKPNSTRIRVALVVVLLLVTPGCMEIIALPFQLVSTAFDILFFWADAPEAAEPTPDAPALADSLEDPVWPVPLSVAVRRALPAAANDVMYVLPADAPLPSDASVPPFPGAVPVSIQISDRHLAPDAEAALESAGIRLVR